MRILGIIPARYASTRFHAKALVDIGGKTMVRRVYEQVQKSQSISKIVVATDHELIANEVKSFGGEVCMTSTEHKSGTERCMEVVKLQKEKFDYVINIQGDEPFISPKQIDTLGYLLNGKIQLATLIKQIGNTEELINPNIVKVIFDKQQEAIYFSRSAIPYARGLEQNEWLNNHKYYKHIGMYAYRCDILEEITKLSPTPLEKAESLEQLRWIEHGFKIKVNETKVESIGIDTPADLEKALKLLNSGDL
ncbi:MAG TPA: 3-deoxy-manno-octulosonate cytidylyltransferase [Cyclobacteriaceae bacterium]|nr:3-deoxy-manno-octulosonate cytidylyltransferase [Cyclobacteriaceae bacterium]